MVKTNLNMGVVEDGILFPVLSYKWFIDTSLPEEYNDIVRKQAVRLEVNIVKRMLTIEVEQPLPYASKMFGAIEILSKGTHRITVQHPSDIDTFVNLVSFNQSFISCSVSKRIY